VNRDEAEEYTAALGQIGGGLWRQILWAQQQGVPAALGLSLREWVDGSLGGYVRMAVEERRRVVAELTDEGMSLRQVADVVGVSKSQVFEDLSTSGQSGDDEQGDEASRCPEVDILPDPDADRSEQVAELARQGGPEPVSAPPLPVGRYACLVIDPPWPMRKIERETRPWQGTELDYPVMTVEQIGDLAKDIDTLAEADAHLYLWVTHRFMPDGLALLKRWGFKYQCLMTWNKNTGIVPYSWMYDTEHVLFATRGALKVARRGLRLSFDEPVAGHSIKPEVFYDRVRLASPGPRLDMFARQTREGFDTWGAEIGAA
jgi:N6-adenosine-specific RNA methylase IME4